MSIACPASPGRRATTDAHRRAGERTTPYAAHRARDIAVEREPAARLVAAGFHDLPGQVGGEVDLESMPGERVVPQNDVAVASGADIDVAAEAQDSAPARR